MHMYVEFTFSKIAKSVALGKFIPSHQSPNMTMKNMSDLSVNNINLTKLTKYYTFLVMII